MFCVFSIQVLPADVAISRRTRLFFQIETDDSSAVTMSILSACMLCDGFLSTRWRRFFAQTNALPE